MSESRQFDRAAIKDRLFRLSVDQAGAFAAACCERLLPNYQRFVEAEGWGDTATLRRGLDAVWRHVAGERVPAVELQQLTAQCAAVIPDTDDFRTLPVSQALDASASICEALQLCLDGDVSRAVAVSSSALDTVDMFVQERDHMQYGSPDFEEHILRDPLMIREIGNQTADLAAIISREHLDSGFVQSLRTKYEGISNLA